MSAYVLDITLTNESEGRSFSEFTEDLEEGWTLKDDGTPDFGKIYRLCQQEYGRCTSSIYVDTDHGPERCGWFFVSRQEYDDWNSNETYLRGAWVSVARVAQEGTPRTLERVVVR